jgi:peptide/nickel transport system substrate-binding protein
MRTRRSLLATMGAVPAIFLPASLAFAQSSKDRVVAALGSDVATLDPTINHAIISYNARINIFDALTDIGPDNNPIPRFATQWEESPDAKTWTFTIRTGAKFHNGDPVTIDDVIYSYQKIMDDERSPTRIHVNHIATIDRISDTQLRFNLHAPFAPFARTASIICVISKRAYQEMGADAFGKRPVGSGPYKVVNWLKDDRIELQAFDDWWGGAPVIKSVWMRAVPSEASRSAALLSGEVDIVPQTPPALIQTLGNRPGVKVKTGPGYKVVFLGFNPANRNLADLKMRQAIDMAIDRNAITKQLLRGLATPTGQIVAKVSFGHDANRDPTKFDPERAKQLIKETGYQGEPIPIQYPNDYIASADAVATAIAGYLRNVGVNVKLEGTEYNTFYSTWLVRKLPGIHLFVFGPNFLDADSPIFSIFVSKGRRGYMFTDHVDELAEATRSAADPKKRAQLISELWAASDAYKPFSFLYEESQASAMRSDIEWEPQPDGFVRFWKVRRTKAL